MAKKFIQEAIKKPGVKKGKPISAKKLVKKAHAKKKLRKK